MDRRLSAHRRRPAHCGHWRIGYGRSMAGIKVAANIAGFMGPLVAMLVWAAPAHASPVRSGAAACALAKTRVATHLHRTRSSIPSCETLRATDSPRGYYILALRGWCRETICGSTLIGWFAVHKRTGRIFEWDVGEDRLGTELRPGR